MNSEIDEQFKMLEPYVDRFGPKVQQYLEEHHERHTELHHGQS